MTLCGGHIHTSFQIRLPDVKEMLQQVDIHTFLTNCGTRTITDLYGVEHRVKDVDVILTRSMCKGPELAYYDFRANEQFRQDYFLRALEGRHFWEGAAHRSRG